MRRFAAWQQPAMTVLLAVGIALRLRLYAANRSLWVDEAYLALNLVGRDFAALLHPLDHAQAAAPGFLLAQRLAIEILGGSEYALRALPLAASIGALVVFWRWASMLLSPPAAVVAVAMFVISPQLLHYAVEVKQYGLDVGLAVAVWWVLTKLKPRLDSDERAAWAMVAALGAVVVWFSHPAVFVVGGAFLVWTWQAARSGAWRALVLRGAAGLLPAASFGVLYLFSLRRVAVQFDGLWRGAEAPLIPLTTRETSKYVQVVYTLSGLPVGTGAGWLVLFSAVIGSIALWRRGYRHGAWFAATLGLVWLASALGKYPVAMRLWLFLTPAVILVTALGVDEVWARTRTTFPALAPILACLLVVYPALGTARIALQPTGHEEVRPLLRHARERYEKGDVLFLYRNAQWAARYYTGRGLSFPGEVIVDRGGRYDSERQVEDLRGARRVWFLFGHVVQTDGLDDDKRLLHLLDRIGVQLDARHEPGASLYLYDLSRAP